MGGLVRRRNSRTHSPTPSLRGRGSKGGFTLIELMVAISVLLVVILATAHIFSTASKVTGTGHAAASVLQEAAVIERMIRDDLARLSPEGFFAIRQVAVPNNVRGPNAPLLNPMLLPNAIIRADQLVFFADGVADMQTFGIGGSVIDEASGGTANQSQGATARVYYGHAFQLSNASPANVIANNNVFAHDPQVDVLPWHAGPVDMLRTRFCTVALGGGSQGTGVYQRTNAQGPLPQEIDGTQPEARQWILARHAVALADDDNASNQANPALKPATNYKTVYLNNRTARSIFRETTPLSPHPVFGWSHEIRNGRMDGAASRLDTIWEYIRTFAPTTQPWPWLNERIIIGEQLLYYPRAERHAPGPHRVDQALTNHVIGSAVSSFIVEWTWSDGAGDLHDEEGKTLCEFDGDIFPCDEWMNGCSGIDCPDRTPFGFYTNWHSDLPYQPEQPWFGLNLPDRGVGHYGLTTYQQFANYKHADTVWVRNIEAWGDGNTFGPPFNAGPNPAQLRIYEAIFGYNRNRPTAPTQFSNWVDEEHPELAFTPWPSAIRVTMTLHDPQGRMEHGREFQFVIDLPKRVRK